MTGIYLYPTKGYNGGWSSNSTDLLYYNGSWVSVSDVQGGAFYADVSNNWKRFYSGLSHSDDFIAGDTQGNTEEVNTEYQLNTDGTIFAFEPNIASGTIGTWDPSGAPDIGDLQVYAVKTTDPGGLYGTYNSWVNLNTGPVWGLISTSSKTAFINFTVRHAPTTTNLMSWNVEISNF